MVSVFTVQMPNNHCQRPSSITHVLLAAVATALALDYLAAAAAEQPQPPMGLPGCPTVCGNVSVPYPFGIGANCSHPGFDLTCDATHSPPRLLLGDGRAAAGAEVTVTDIFLQNATMRVTSHAIINQTSHVAAANGTWGLSGGDDDRSADGPFILSYNHNKFAALGCSVQATLLGDGGDPFVSGCSASCWGGDSGHFQQPIGDRRCSDECSGNGCCQESIPLYYPSYDVRLVRLDDPTHIDDALPTVIVYIAEKGWIDGVWCRIMGLVGNGSRILPLYPPPELLSAVPLSDFGASRYIPVDQEGFDTTVQGTLGYLDPTYHTTEHLTDKSDVYSFGVLLIELLTRKKPTSSSQGFALVSHFVGLLSQGNLDQILDPQVAREGDGEIVDIALLAQMCVKSNREERPTMRQVEIMLESIQAAKEFSSD
ncbi:unnamed protein product [Urochloa decumbens]|uniref:Protein kinase domain-containing protein n=1 Tax=Urochloa decumbens TaxID=240449 RepID=A0ABC9B2G2_9POAL